jgi:hypothetical protein
LLAAGWAWPGRSTGTSPELPAARRETLAAACERILPETDTPGARAAGVPEFIERMLADWFDAAEREAFLAGLERLDALARERGAARFALADESIQDGILAQLEQESLAARATAPDASLLLGYRLPTAAPRQFFTALKELVLVGYYTSEIGATRELHWNPVPGRFEPCHGHAEETP